MKEKYLKLNSSALAVAFPVHGIKHYVEEERRTKQMLITFFIHALTVNARILMVHCHHAYEKHKM